MEILMIFSVIYLLYVWRTYDVISFLYKMANNTSMEHMEFRNENVINAMQTEPTLWDPAGSTGASKLVPSQLVPSLCWFCQLAFHVLRINP